MRLCACTSARTTKLTNFYDLRQFPTVPRDASLRKIVYLVKLKDRLEKRTDTLMASRLSTERIFIQQSIVSVLDFKSVNLQDVQFNRRNAELVSGWTKREGGGEPKREARPNSYRFKVHTTAPIETTCAKIILLHLATETSGN